ncbi:low molecular weight protein arginine phosphatase [Bacillus sp. HMF5848]|uniref:low molecular weight protein arginine phosphatase n=1 Tax=Bacillus sp. HMF5848 TaxID=2495421 RepID=UPI000F792D70|nr:low molecular weight protein arginine phosphatase [Bacillus sp. HMF5848]RSK28954.1 low molecular weight protein arginine phosphatase [Bacillus sp. HMF5848]
MNILFVCTGNTCRSPMAEALFKHKVGQKHNVKSAGVFALPGNAVSPHAEEVLQENGISCNHRSSPLTLDLVDWADWIITMTSNHKEHVKQQFPQAIAKTKTITEFAVGTTFRDVADPFGGSLEDYRQTYQQLSELIDKVMKKLENT